MTTVGYGIPMDLTIEILLKLPAETLLRFKSVSKSWCSIISSQQFVNSFMSLSLSRPRIFLVCNNCNDDRLLFFSPRDQSFSFSSSSSMLVAKKYTLTMIRVKYFNNYIFNSVRGFVCLSLWDQYVVCNPTTRQVILLGNHGHNCQMYLGYDANSDKYKVLRLMSLKSPGLCIEYSVRTLGSSDSWRSIKSSNHYHSGIGNDVCIDGVVYYTCINVQNLRELLCSFNVGSELLGLIQTPEDLMGDLTDYMGKLVVHCSIDNGFNLWVLDDVKNQVWSKKTYVFPIGSKLYNVDFRFMGISACGEIVLSVYTGCFSGSLELLCYDVEKKVERSVRVEGLSHVNRTVGFYCSLLCSYVNNFINL